MDARRPPQAGYGLPCAKCHRYFPADLDACPNCKGSERVAPVVAPMAPTPPKVQTSAEPMPGTVVPEQERGEFLKQFKSPVSVAETKTAPAYRNPDDRPGEGESAPVPKLPRVQASAGPMPVNVVLKEEMLAALVETNKSPAVSNVKDRDHAEKKSATVSRLPDVPASAGRVPEAVAPEQEPGEFSKQLKFPIRAGQVDADSPAAGNPGDHHPDPGERQPWFTGVRDASHPPPRPEKGDGAERETLRNESAGAHLEQARPNRGRQHDRVTIALAGVVLACAVLMTVLVVLRFGVHRAKATHKGASANVVAATPQQNANSSNGSASSLPAGTVGNSASTDSSSAAGSPGASGEKVTPSTAQPGAGAAVAPASSDDLQISKDGKEVLRVPPPASGEKQKAKGSGAEHASSVGPTQPLVLSADAAESNLLHRVEPDYPSDARSRGIQGTVVLDLRIGKNGAVQNVGIVSGETVLVEAATAAVKQWRFKPHYADGHPVEVQTRVTLSFILHNS